MLNMGTRGSDIEVLKEPCVSVCVGCIGGDEQDPRPPALSRSIFQLSGTLTMDIIPSYHIRSGLLLLNCVLIVCLLVGPV